MSGRGVGLDVVVQSMERLNGLIEAETIPGAGTKFTLQLPLTLAIITVLMVEVAGAVYALPSGAVVESLRFPRSDVTRINGRDTLRVRDRIVPLLHLARALRGAGAPAATRAYAVIVGRGREAPRAHRGPAPRPAGRGHQGRSTPWWRRRSVGIAGATILGDGRVVLILDVASLFEGRRARARGRSAAEA